jgi:hypothetical protein
MSVAHTNLIIFKHANTQSTEGTALVYPNQDRRSQATKILKFLR